jgi:hypothetical protein
VGQYLVIVAKQVMVVLVVEWVNLDHQDKHQLLCILIQALAEALLVIMLQVTQMLLGFLMELDLVGHLNHGKD